MSINEFVTPGDYANHITGTILQSGETRMTEQPKHRHINRGEYQAFLVRVWKDGEEGLWRGSVQSVQTGEITRYASLTELFMFLEAQTEGSEVEQPPTYDSG